METLELLNGILLLIFNVIALLIGTKILSKYIQYKQKVLLYIGFTWIFLSCPWYPAGISFIMFLVTRRYLNPVIYMIIGNIFIPIAIILWLVAFTDLVWKKKHKIVIPIFMAYSAVFYVIFFYLLSIDPLLIGDVKGIDVQYNTFIVFYTITILIVIIFTAILFILEAMKSDNPEIQLKGKFLLLAFALFIVGALLDSILGLNYIILLITRGFQITAGISFYLGFILPAKVKKIFLGLES